VPRLQFILVIEPDHDSRVTYAEYLQTFRIVTGIRVPASRTPKCQQVYRRVMVL
jgi:hypothetical protein